MGTPGLHKDIGTVFGRGNRTNHSSEDSAANAESGSIAGFIVAEVERGAGHIITIDVMASARRHGIGSLLLGSAEERLRAAGCRLVELETAVDNASALSFYKRQGYTVVETLPRYYSNGVDALVLQKPLVVTSSRLCRSSQVKQAE